MAVGTESHIGSLDMDPSGSETYRGSQNWGPIFGVLLIGIIIYWALFLGPLFLEAPFSILPKKGHPKVLAVMVLGRRENDSL